MEELKRMLEGVSDSYPDFVRGVSAVCKKYPDIIDAIKKYIKDHKDADSSDITEKLYDMIEL